MSEFPENFPFDEEQAVLLTGKTANRLMALGYGLKFINGSVTFNDDNVELSFNPPTQATLVKPTEELDGTNLSGSLTGTGFYKGKIFERGIVDGGETRENELIIAVDSEGTFNGELSLDVTTTATVIKQTWSAGDLRTLGFTLSANLADDALVSWETFFVFQSSGGGEGGGGAIPAIITGGSDGNYSVDLYEDGISEPSTGSATLEVLNLNISETLPVGTKVMAHPAALTITAGN